MAIVIIMFVFLIFMFGRMVYLYNKSDGFNDFLGRLYGDNDFNYQCFDGNASIYYNSIESVKYFRESFDSGFCVLLNFSVG